jgi:hypothetical protein
MRQQVRSAAHQAEVFPILQPNPKFGMMAVRTEHLQIFLLGYIYVEAKANLWVATRLLHVGN